MTRQELAFFDGKEGRRAYVAVNAKIYDFTDSPLWRQGLHAKQHQAGTDLTEELLKAPHVRAVVERFPVVAMLEEAVPPPSRKGPLLLGVGAVILAAIALIYLFGI
jgi:predicted heme/steroid binding protein